MPPNVVAPVKVTVNVLLRPCDVDVTVTILEPLVDAKGLEPSVPVAPTTPLSVTTLLAIMPCAISTTVTLAVPVKVVKGFVPSVPVSTGVASIVMVNALALITELTENVPSKKAPGTVPTVDEFANVTRSPAIVLWLAITTVTVLLLLVILYGLLIEPEFTNKRYGVMS